MGREINGAAKLKEQGDEACRPLCGRKAGIQVSACERSRATFELADGAAKDTAL